MELRLFFASPCSLKKKRTESALGAEMNAGQVGLGFRVQGVGFRA
jgi:hypothetical protein